MARAGHCAAFGNRRSLQHESHRCGITVLAFVSKIRSWVTWCWVYGNCAYGLIQKSRSLEPQRLQGSGASTFFSIASIRFMTVGTAAHLPGPTSSGNPSRVSTSRDPDDSGWRELSSVHRQPAVRVFEALCGVGHLVASVNRITP